MTDEFIFDLIEDERLRQSTTLNMIASENLVSDDVLKAQGSILQNKYAEGYPGKRYYQGNEVVDRIENEAIKRANQLDVSFQAAVFTKNIDKAFKAVKRLNGTTVMVNDHTAFRVDWMPFGGAKTSGLGLGGIPDSMAEMQNQKMMVIKSPSL